MNVTLKSSRIPIILLIVSLLAGCQFGPLKKDDVTKGADKEIRPDHLTSKPVLALLDRAQLAAEQGNISVAEVQLERALRIEPGNPALWHYMAKLRLHQGRLSQAAGLAAKSNSLDRNKNRQLRADNWRIIAHARHRKGDVAGARAAQAKVDALTDRQPGSQTNTQTDAQGSD